MRFTADGNADRIRVFTGYIFSFLDGCDFQFDINLGVAIAQIPQF